MMPWKTNLRHFAFLLIVSTPGLAMSQDTSLVYDGFTEPEHDIMVAAVEIGRLEEVLVKPGDRVAKGQVVARLEDSMQRASVKIADLQSKMQGEIEAARAEVMLHNEREKQIRRLATENMARPDELLRAEADLRIAESRYKTALEQQQLRGLELERYRLQVDRRKVMAPMNGVVAKVFRKPGEYITPSDPSVIRLLVTDKLHAVFAVPIEDADRMTEGADVRVYLRSRAKTIHAKIASLATAIDGESGTIEVRVILDNKESKLLAGDRCTMQLAPNKRQARLPAVYYGDSDASQARTGALAR